MVFSVCTCPSASFLSEPGLFLHRDEGLQHPLMNVRYYRHHQILPLYIKGEALAPPDILSCVTHLWIPMTFLENTHTEMFDDEAAAASS